MKDYSGLKFVVAEEMGDCMDCFFAQLNLAKNNTTFHRFSHINHDGIGGLYKILERQNYHLPPMPVLAKGHIPSAKTKAHAFIRFVKKSKAKKLNWNFSRDFNKTGKTAGFVFTHFSKDDTQLIQNFCKRQGYGLTALLTWAIDHVMANEFLSGSRQRQWISAINMRQEKGVKIPYGNNSASIIFQLENESSPAEIHTMLKDYLKQGLHFGSHIYSNLARFIGHKGIRYLASKMQNSYFGVMSNMGEWPPKGHINSGQERDQCVWSPVAPASKLVPIASTSLIWENKLALNLQLHPSLERSLENTQELLKKWALAIQSKALGKSSFIPIISCPRELLYRKSQEL